MPYLFTSESVSEGHPDKVADQISDAVLDAMLMQDPDSRVACETLVTTGLVVVAGEVTTKAFVDLHDVVRKTIKKIGYTEQGLGFDAESCAIMVALHSQSPDIAQGVNEGEGVDKEQGAGDQGMMFGYANRETAELMPMPLAFAHRILKKLSEIRNEGKVMTYLKPDSKSQVSVEYDDSGKAIRVDTIVVSTQHADGVSRKKIEDDIRTIVIPQVIPAELLVLDGKKEKRTKFHINPTGRFVIGGPHGDSGLTGRKIIVDTYGGKGAHGGGAFSGKDPSKVDRSAAYATRHIAKNLVAAGVCDEILVQVSYAIGVAKPVSIFVNTYGSARVKFSDAQIAQKIGEIFDLTPKAIIDRFGLKNPIYSETASFGHFGRPSYEKEVETNYVTVTESSDKTKVTEVRQRKMKKVRFFGWEALDYVKKVKTAFGIKG